MAQKIAIVLNKNARSVTASVISKINKMIAENETIFISKSLKSLKEIAKKIVEDKFDVVLCGGGDGTFCLCVSEIMALSKGSSPAFGVLRLGTGNGLADTLGSGKTGIFVDANVFIEELVQARDHNARMKQYMIRVGNMWAPFGGLGLDALVLEDYNFVKKISKLVSFLPSRVRGLSDYLFAIGLKSLWRFLANPFPEVTIINGSRPAQKLDINGKPDGCLIMPGEVIKQGRFSLVGFSTIERYGFGLRMFPHVGNLPSRYFQLRFTAMNAWEMLENSKDILMGNLRHEKLWDYACGDIKIKTSSPMPMQVGGDFEGRVSSVDVSVDTITVVRGSEIIAP